MRVFKVLLENTFGVAVVRKVSVDVEVVLEVSRKYFAKGLIASEAGDMGLNDECCEFYVGLVCQYDLVLVGGCLLSLLNCFLDNIGVE